MEMSILIKEHFNRWYSLKSYYVMVNIVDIPVAVSKTQKEIQTNNLNKGGKNCR